MKNNQTIKLTPKNIIFALRTAIAESGPTSLLLDEYREPAESVLNGLIDKFESPKNPELEMLTQSLQVKTTEKEKCMQAYEDAHKKFTSTYDTAEKNKTSELLTKLTNKINTLDVAIYKLNDKIQKKQASEFKFTSTVAQRAFTALVRMLDYEYNVLKFNDKQIFTFEKRLHGNRKERFTSMIISKFVGQFVSCDSRIAFAVYEIVSAVLNEYPLGETGDIFKADDETVRSEAIELFAKVIDAQAGKGAFAAYFLYPKLFKPGYVFNDKGEDIFKDKRTIVVGTRTATGKSILVKLASALYGPLTKVLMPRPTKAKNGYDVGKLQWNTVNKDVVIGLIDDDEGNKGDNASQEDFYKNVYDENALHIYKGRNIEDFTTFEGNFYANINSMETSFKKLEVSRRVYFLHLVVFAKMYLTGEQLNELASYNADSNADALINYLNAHEEDAIQWFRDYEKKYEPRHIYSGETDSDIKAKQQEAMTKAAILKFIEERIAETKHGRILLSTVASAFAGSAKVTMNYVNEISEGYYVCKPMRIKDGSGSSSTKNGISKTLAADAGNVKKPVVSIPRLRDEDAQALQIMKALKLDVLDTYEDLNKETGVDVDMFMEELEEVDMFEDHDFSSVVPKVELKKSDIDILGLMDNASKLAKEKEIVESVFENAESTKHEELPDVDVVKTPNIKTVDKSDMLNEFVEASDKRMKESVTIEASDTVKLFANVKQIEKTELTAVEIGNVVAVFADETTDEKEVGTYLSEISGQAIEAVDAVEVNADTVVTLINNGQTVDDTTEKATGVDFESITSFAYAVEKLEGVVVATTSSDDTPW